MSTTNTRMTKQRMVILGELRKVNTHPTADEIYALVRRKIPRISLGTVYRNLDFLAESKEIIKLDSAGPTRRFDGDTRPHQHVRCTKCGRVGDLMSSLPALDFGSATAQGFTITNLRVEYDGICDDCLLLMKNNC